MPTALLAAEPRAAHVHGTLCHKQPPQTPRVPGSTGGGEQGYDAWMGRG